jgi:hypothetical protein
MDHADNGSGNAGFPGSAARAARSWSTKNEPIVTSRISIDGSEKDA